MDRHADETDGQSPPPEQEGRPDISKDPASDPGPPENPEVDQEKLEQELDNASKEL